MLVLMAAIDIGGAVVRNVWPLGKRFLKQGGAMLLSAFFNLFKWNNEYDCGSHTGEKYLLPQRHSLQ